MLLRCFDKDALVSNSSTSVNLVEGSFAKEPTTVTVYTSQNLSKLEDFKVGAVWAGDYDSSKDTAEQKDKFNDKNELCRYPRRIFMVTSWFAMTGPKVLVTCSSWMAYSVCGMGMLLSVKIHHAVP